MLQGGGDELAETEFFLVLKGFFEGVLGGGAVVAEVDKGFEGVLESLLLDVGWGGGFFEGNVEKELLESVAKFDEESLGGFFADARDFAKGCGIFTGDHVLEVGEREVADKGKGDFWADSGDFDDFIE